MNEPLKYDLVFREIARGDEDAYQLLRGLLEWFHVHDDLIDGKGVGHPLSAEGSVFVFLRLVDIFSDNKFYQTHKAALRPVIRISAIAYLDSERLSRSENLQDKLSAEILKSQYQDIFWAVADCIGGWEFAREMSIKHRAYYFG